MEHRWGERVFVQVTVELSCGALAPISGLLQNLSSSGAFVRTEGCRPPRGPVEVTLIGSGEERGSSIRLPAYIVRESDSGVGIEWCEFAPRVVRELLSRDRREKRAGARRPLRSPSSIRRAAHKSNSGIEPRAPTAPPIGATLTDAAALGHGARAAH
ncbi:MAG TPA: PilZ domain-containing protein [Steroidobacteraceae bacterium]|nr:PilZ domain-containing protein [Steroidobacteraceae bacterium]